MSRSTIRIGTHTSIFTHDEGVPRGLVCSAQSAVTQVKIELSQEADARHASTASAEVRSEALLPILIGQVRGYQRISPVVSGQVPHCKESAPIAASTQYEGRLHPLDILAAHHLGRKAPQFLQHALCSTCGKLADHPARQPIRHVHETILL